MTNLKARIEEILSDNLSSEMKINKFIEMVEYIRDKYYDEGYEDGMADGVDEVLEETLLNAKIY